MWLTTSAEVEYVIFWYISIFAPGAKKGARDKPVNVPYFAGRGSRGEYVIMCFWGSVGDRGGARRETYRNPLNHLSTTYIPFFRQAPPFSYIHLWEKESHSNTDSTHLLSADVVVHACCFVPVHLSIPLVFCIWSVHKCLNVSLHHISLRIASPMTENNASSISSPPSNLNNQSATQIQWPTKAQHLTRNSNFAFSQVPKCGTSDPLCLAN